MPEGTGDNAISFPYIDNYQQWARAGYDPDTNVFHYKIGSD